jgi:hypothetical protein
MSDNFNWRNISELSGFDEFLGDYLETNSYQINKNLSSYFVVGQPIDPEYNSKNLSILFFQNYSDMENLKPMFYFEVDSMLIFNSAKKMVENTVEQITNLISFHPEGLTVADIKNNLHEQFNNAQIEIINKWEEASPESVKKSYTSEQSPVSDRQLETAQKTGYVQGVCESVLAFNNDENRKIMTEATMTFLSKKLLSEMKVTKDMAQKFANPETYKALEQSVFAPKQEQKLEQTQSQGFKR